MKRQIIIYLHIQNQHDALARASWIVQEPGQTRAPIFHGDLQTAANHAMGCRVVVLVPAEMMTLTLAELPAMNKQRLLKALPFALEEQVAADVDELHFCLGKRDAQDRQICAVIETDVLSHWLAVLKDYNIQPDLITSEIYGVPQASSTEQKSWTLLFMDATRHDGRPETKVLLRTSANTGLSIDLSNCAALITHFIDNQSADDRPETLRIITCADVPATQLNDEARVARETSSSAIAAIVDQLRDVCESRQVTLQRDDSEDELLGILAQGFDEAYAINVLQGQFSRKEQFEKLIRPWRAAAGIVAVWLVLQLGLMIADYRKLVQVDAQLRTEILETFKTAFPDAKNIIDPKLQMQRGLDELTKGGGGTDMILMLAKTGNIIRETDTLDMKGVRYKENTLDLDFEIADLQSLDQLKIRLINETGFAVEIVSASAKGGKVESRLQLKPTVSS